MQCSDPDTAHISLSNQFHCISDSFISHSQLPPLSCYIYLSEIPFMQMLQKLIKNPGACVCGQEISIFLEKSGEIRFL